MSIELALEESLEEGPGFESVSQLLLLSALLQENDEGALVLKQFGDCPKGALEDVRWKISTSYCLLDELEELHSVLDLLLQGTILLGWCCCALTH